MNKKTFHLLEFDKVRQLLIRYASFTGGSEFIQRFQPTTDLTEAVQRQAETAEAVAILQSETNLTIGGCRDIREIATNARRGYILQPEDLLDIRSTIIASQNVQETINKVADSYPRLASITNPIPPCPGLINEIDQTIDDHGEILDSATPKLAKIRSELRITYNRIQSKLQSILNGPNSSFLQESLISSRNGRYVIPLKSDAKGRIPGIVHDQSGTGATLWVEPLSTVETNNQYRTLQMDEKNEIQRILAELTARVAFHSSALKQIIYHMSVLDFVLARAKYAIDINGIEPEFVPWRTVAKKEQYTHHPGGTIWIRAARHPLLDPNTVVPTNFLLDEKTFMILITGPNTGGKTVSLKTIGLMILMAQSGLHLPAQEAKISIFNQIYADIGDEQSIEQSLSTFSSHMTNIINVLEKSDDRTLILFDELGSGTDPSEGAALAQAIINYLRDKGATAFVATHYPALKLYANTTEGVRNASLVFDIETLSPTYEMIIGVPGRSNALAISQRLGLNESILQDAQKLLGTETAEADKLLDSLYNIQEEISSQEASTRVHLNRIKGERDALQKRLDNIEAERQTILNEARLQARSELQEMRIEIRQLRQTTNAPHINKKELVEKIDTIEKAVPPMLISPTMPPPKEAKKTKLEVGDHVHISSVNASGTILAINKNVAEIAVGRMHLKAKLKELSWQSSPPPPIQSTSSEKKMEKHVSPGLELDIRGERVEEGISKVEQFIDRAYLARLPWVHIIHGKGTGRLRQAVQQTIQSNQHVTSYRIGEDGEGGTGVTVVKLE